VREDVLGLTYARIRGISEARGALLVFVDDDNVLAGNFLEVALETSQRYRELGAFGAGSIVPEFEEEPAPALRPYLGMLAIRSVHEELWSNHAEDHQVIPWGAGLCVRRPIAQAWVGLVQQMNMSHVGRTGNRLFAGDDDLFSWVAAFEGSGFGIFPGLRVLHLISAKRIRPDYLLSLIHDHTFSHRILRFRLDGTPSRRLDWTRRVHVLLHGLRNGAFSMRWQWAIARAEDEAARAIADDRLAPLSRSDRPVAALPHERLFEARPSR
jgi:hypothetical protein